MFVRGAIFLTVGLAYFGGLLVARFVSFGRTMSICSTFSWGSPYSVYNGVVMVFWVIRYFCSRYCFLHARDTNGVANSSSPTTFVSSVDVCFGSYLVSTCSKLLVEFIFSLKSFSGSWEWSSGWALLLTLDTPPKHVSHARCVCFNILVTLPR